MTVPLRTARTADAMPRSEIRSIMDLAWAQSADVVRLEVGEPGFPTPQHVVEAARQALADGHTKYLPNAGLPALREVVAAKIRARNRYDATPEDVVVTNGGVQALFSVLSLLADRGDEVLIPDPAWPNFRMQAHLLGLVDLPYALTADGGFLPDIDELEHLVSSRTRVLLLNSPSNPLGTVIPRRRLEELVAFAGRHDLWIVADEVYDELVFDDSFASVGTVADGYERVISLYSCSKVYAMTGWRVGYVVAPRTCARLLADLQEPVVSCINAPAQFGAVAAISGPQDSVREMREAYRRRRETALEALCHAGLGAHRPSGAFYVWATLPEGVPSSGHVARRLVVEAGVAIAPGTAFGRGGERNVRVSLAAEDDVIREGLGRLERWLLDSARR